MKTNTPGLKRDWAGYYDAIANRPPRKTLLTALDSFAKPGIALDLGCGDGRDTVELLRRGWTVLAIDKESEAINRLSTRPNINTKLLNTQVISFEQLQFPPEVDLINASFSLPFCPSEAFPALWNKIITSLRPGGRFCGQLFGDRDSWATSPLLNCHTRQQIEQLLQPFELEMLEEEEHPGKTPLGEERYWHIFHIVARKVQTSDEKYRRAMTRL